MGPYYKLDVAAAIVVTNGVYANMSPLLGRNRTRIRDYILANPDMKEFYDDVRASLLDKVEDNQFNRALSGKDDAAERFVLTSLAKDRGYGANGKVVVDTGPIEEDGDAFEIRLVPRGGRATGVAKPADTEVEAP